MENENRVEDETARPAKSKLDVRTLVIALVLIGGLALLIGLNMN